MACIDCHDPTTMQLRVTRPGFLEGIRALKASQGVQNYDVNAQATRQEMRTSVCGQCHVENYFKGPEKRGIHARSGVACADCHMPYKREGALKISDHHVRSPLLNVNQTCHNWTEAELTQRVTTIQDRTFELRNRALDAMGAGKTDADLKTAMELQRRAQFMVDFVEAENSMGFHAPEEAARILGIAMDLARQGQLAVRQADYTPNLFPSTTPSVKPTEREVTPAPGSATGGSTPVRVTAPATEERRSPRTNSPPRAPSLTPRATTPLPPGEGRGEGVSPPGLPPVSLGRGTGTLGGHHWPPDNPGV